MVFGGIEKRKDRINKLISSFNDAFGALNEYLDSKKIFHEKIYF